MFEKVSYEIFKDAILAHGEIPEDSIRQMYDMIKLPVRSTQFSAGYDFFSPIGFPRPIPAGTPVIIPTGIKCNLNSVETSDPNQGKFLALYPRSSYGFKYGMRLMNTVGIIDEDYYNNNQNEGHIIVAITAMSDIPLNMGTKFCQGIIQPYYKITNSENITSTREGGIGSTDENDEDNVKELKFETIED